MTTASPSTNTPADAAAQLFDAPVELESLTPEAGARRYFRAVNSDGAPTGWLLVTAPDPPPHASEAWLRGCGIRAPRLGSEVGGAYLVEDLGDRHLAHAPHPDAYRQLLADWRRFSSSKLPEGHPNTRLALDRALFVKELGFFHEHWVLGLRATRSRDTSEADAKLLQQLAAAAADGPWSPQHRDFHSRNLLLPDEGSPAWIDHQDLRPGPLYYDLASLLTDAYVDLDKGVTALLIDEIEALASHHELDTAIAERQFHATALQRVLKALGTFAMLLGRGRDDYAAAERRAFAHAERLFDRAPEWAPLRKLLIPS